MLDGLACLNFLGELGAPGALVPPGVLDFHGHHVNFLGPDFCPLLPRVAGLLLWHGNNYIFPF